MSRPASESEETRPEKEPASESGPETGTSVQPEEGLSSPEGDVEESSPAPPRREGIDWLTVALVLVALVNVVLWFYLEQRPDRGSAQATSPPPPPPQAVSPPPPPPPVLPPPPDIDAPPPVGLGSKDQLDAGLPILKEMGLDITPVRVFYRQSINAGRFGKQKDQLDAEKQALQEAARLLEQFFTTQMATLGKTATPDRIKQAEALAEQGKAKAEKGRLTDAIQFYQQAQKILKGG